MSQARVDSRRTRPLLILALLAPLSVASATPGSGTGTLPNGVAAGEVSAGRAVLWTRSTDGGSVLFELATDASFQTIVQSGVESAPNPRSGVKRAFDGLAPGTTYYYRASDTGGSTATGRFRTARAPDAHFGLHFGVSGDSRGDNQPYWGIEGAALADLDFFVSLGDTIYADIESPILPGVTQAASLDEFRAKHVEVYSPAGGIEPLADLRGSTAWWTTIDDHEVTNDFAGGAHPSTDPRFDNTGEFINETILYGNGLRAFQDYNPLDDLFYGATGDPRTAHKRKLYRSQVFGRDAAIFVLDARSFRDEGLGSAFPTDPEDVVRYRLASLDPDRTMLGRAQIDELKADLVAADAAGVTWKFVVVPEPIQSLGVLAASDRFDGYAAERNEILEFLVDEEIDNVAFIAADIHGTLINDLTIYPTATGPGIPTSYFEVTTGPIAFDAPFGPTVVSIGFLLGFLTADDVAFYLSLPLPLMDAFVQRLVDYQLLIQGLDPIGLDGGLVNATLDVGGWSATHYYGWSEFEIDAVTQELTITTWGTDFLVPVTPPVVINRVRVQAQ